MVLKIVKITIEYNNEMLKSEVNHPKILFSKIIKRKRDKLKILDWLKSKK